MYVLENQGVDYFPRRDIFYHMSFPGNDQVTRIVVRELCWGLVLSGRANKLAAGVYHPGSASKNSTSHYLEEHSLLLSKTALTESTGNNYCCSLGEKTKPAEKIGVDFLIYLFWNSKFQTQRICCCMRNKKI